MRKIMIPMLVLLALPLAAQAQQMPGGKKIQCWTDDKGNRSCGDHVPPQYAKKEREIFNQQGVVVAKKARQLTPEEVAEADRKAAEAAAAQKQAEAQAAYDRFLTDTYSSVKELESARDARLQIIDGRSSLAQKSIADAEKTLIDLRSRVDSAKAASKLPADRLLKQVKKFEDALADNTNAVTQLQAEREKTQTKFNQDIERYKQLRPGR
jgi:hypothetical protein